MAQQDGVANAGSIKDAGKNARFVPHVGQRPGQRLRIGLAIAEARKGEYSAAGGPGKQGWNVAPKFDAAQPFVQQDQGWGFGGRRAPPGGFQAALVEAKEFAAHAALTRRRRGVPGSGPPQAVLLYRREEL